MYLPYNKEWLGKAISFSVQFATKDEIVFGNIISAEFSDGKFIGYLVKDINSNRQFANVMETDTGCFEWAQVRYVEL